MKNINELDFWSDKTFGFLARLASENLPCMELTNSKRIVYFNRIEQAAVSYDLGVGIMLPIYQPDHIQIACMDRKTNAYQMSEGLSTQQLPQPIADFLNRTEHYKIDETLVSFVELYRNQNGVK